MKNLNDFLNEDLNINESLSNKIYQYYQRNIKNRISIADVYNMIKSELKSNYKNYGLEIKKASDVVNDKNCVTLNLDEEYMWEIIDVRSPIYNFLDHAGNSLKKEFLEFYKKNPEASVACIYDKRDSNPIYSIMDVWMFAANMNKKEGINWMHSTQISKKTSDFYIEHCIREIDIYKRPEYYKDTTEKIYNTVGGDKKIKHISGTGRMW